MKGLVGGLGFMGVCLGFIKGTLEIRLEVIKALSGVCLGSCSCQLA